jgi:hypothetical protein
MYVGPSSAGRDRYLVAKQQDSKGLPDQGDQIGRNRPMGDCY